MIDILTDDDHKKFPPIEEYIENLKNLCKIDFSGISPKEISEKFFDAAVMYSHIASWTTPKEFKRAIFYRVRLNIDESIEDINLIKTFSYPPQNISTVNNRANVAGKSVFYCSDDPITALLETKPKKGDSGYMSIWSVNTDQKVKYNLNMHPTITDINPWQLLAQEANNYASSEGYKQEGIVSEHMRYLREFISQLFITECRPYYITSMLGDIALFGDSDIDFLAYPSVMVSQNRTNIAFHPNSVDLILMLSKVIRFKVVEIHGESIELSFGHVADLVNRRLKWRKRTDDDLKFMGSFLTKKS